MRHCFQMPARGLALAATLGLTVACAASAQVAVAEGTDPQASKPALQVEDSGEAAFLAENDAAMEKMMRDMAVKPTGDVDADFVAMMVPHHQGAIDMAQAVLRFGKNEQIRRIAQEIVIEQTQEIAAMRRAVGKAPEASAGPGAASAPDLPLSHRDRVYAAEQFSNTVSVTDPASNQLLGIIRLGEPQPANFSPLYRGQVLVHGLGFSPDHKTLAVVSVGSNSVTFIDTATNRVKRTTYVGRSPHEAFFTPDGSEVWVSVRGENYVAVLDGKTFDEKARIITPAGPGMQIFSPDGKYGYICSSFTPETVVVAVEQRQIVGRVPQASPFCPNIAATPDGSQVWFTLKDIGKTQVFDARPPFQLLTTLDTGPITNHVNFVRNAHGSFAYVTVGGLNQVKVFRTDNFALVARIPVGILPHGLWPSGDGMRVYVGLENADALAVIDTLENRVIATIAIGQAPQAVVYVPGAVPEGDAAQNLQPLGVAGQAAHLALGPTPDAPASGAGRTSVSLFDQGLIQVLQAAVAGLEAKKPYVLAFAKERAGKGSLEPLSAFVTNPAGAAIVNATGPIRQIVQHDVQTERRYLVIAEGTAARPGRVVQVQTQ